MANYYHEARAHVKHLKTLQEENKRKAERRAEIASTEAEHPLNLLIVDGRPCKLHRSTEQYHSIERMDGLIPWNGQQDNLIDRFDGRALLDFYKEPDERMRQPTKNLEEEKLDELLIFENYRDLVRLSAKGMAEENAITFVQKENIELRAAARSTAAAAIAAAHGQRPGQNQPQPSQYAAIGFSYAQGDAVPSLSSSSDEESDEGEEEAVTEQELMQEEAEDEKLDQIAEGFGIEDYSYRLHKSLKLEGEQAAFAQRKRRRFSRKKAAERARRMAGMGLDPYTKPDFMAKIPERDSRADKDGKDREADLRRGNTSRDERPPWRKDDREDHHRHRHRSRSRSRSPRRHREDRPRTEFITEFSARVSSRHEDTALEKVAPRRADILEALPDRPDPAIGGGAVSLPAEGSTMQGIKAHEPPWRRDYERREREHERERGRTAPAQAPAKPSSALTARAGSGGVPEKETPAERLKRIMQAQLNKQVSKDSMSVTQKKLQAEKDRQARLQIERAAFARRSPSPRRRSQSPPSPRRRRRSYSRSPSR